MFSCNLRCLLIFFHGRSRTYRVASLRAGPVGRISYNLYFDCKHVRYVTCDFNKRIYLYFYFLRIIPIRYTLKKVYAMDKPIFARKLVLPDIGFSALVQFKR